MLKAKTGTKVSSEIETLQNLKKWKIYLRVMNKIFGYHGLNIIENHPQVSLVLDVSALNRSFQAKVVKSKNIKQCFY